MNNLEGNDRDQILIFALGEQFYSLSLSAVERVVRAVEITPLPKAPEIVIGVINVHGQIIPVVDICRRLNLPRHELISNDRFILARTSRRSVVLIADSVVGIRELSDQEMVSAEQILPGTEYIKGLAKLDDNLVLICDLDRFLSLDDESELETALGRGNGRTTVEAK